MDGLRRLSTRWQGHVEAIGKKTEALCRRQEDNELKNGWTTRMSVTCWGYRNVPCKPTGRKGWLPFQPHPSQNLQTGRCRETAQSSHYPNTAVMSHYFIEASDPRVADLFRRLEKAGKALDKLESSGGRTLKGERFVTDEGIVRLLENQQAYIAGTPHGADHSYYLIQERFIRRNPRYRNFWKIPGRNVSGTGMGIKKNGHHGRSSSVQYRVHAGGLPDDGGRRSPSDSHRRKASAFRFLSGKPAASDHFERIQLDNTAVT